MSAGSRLLLSEDGCPSADAISSFLAGRLDGDGLHQLEVHLDSCARCRELLALAAADVSPFGSRAPDSGVPSQLASPRSRHQPPAVELSAGRPAALRQVSDEEYSVVRELGRGGMGRILLAHAREGRLVALKVLLERSTGGERRFLREMQITARLQHPSIVTLYECGLWRSGEPFFAMKLVEGHTLREELQVRTTLEQRLALLPRLIAVTDAIAYAHDRGVIHRDLKPGNILVGAFGETVVIDWGLAKMRSCPELPEWVEGSWASSAASSEGTLSTKAGAMLGTPAYMPPEQVRGEPVDERADVYGLGALLYHVLAGHPPHTERARQDVLARLRAGPPPLEERAPGLPVDLAAIVRRAMHADAARRYPTAKEMAADLRRFAAGQLVSVHAYSLAALGKRWLRKHRAAVGVGATLLLASGALGMLSVQRIIDERNRAEVQTALATAQHSAAEQLVGFLITGFRDRVSNTDRLHLLQGVGEMVGRYYREVQAAGATVDANTLWSRAATLETLGIVEFDRRNLSTARSLYRQALALCERAGALRAASGAELLRHGALWQRVGTLEHVDGNVEPALEAHARAIELAELGATRGASDLDAGLLAAANWERISMTLQNRKGDLSGSFDAARQGISRLEPLRQRHRDETRLSQKLALLLQTASDLQLSSGRLDDARQSIHDSLELFADVVRREPRNGVAVRQHAYALMFLANVELSRGRLRPALEAQHAMLERYAELARLEPDNRATQEDMAVGHSLDCDMHRRALELAEAEAAGHAAVKILREHSKSNANRKSRSLLVMALRDLGRVQVAKAELAKGRNTLQEAVTLARGLTAEDPDVGRWRADLISALTSLAEVERRLDRTAALRALEEALPLARTRAESSPTDAEAQADLARAAVVRGDVAMDEGDEPGARSAYRAAVDGLADEVERSGSSIDLQVEFARAQSRLALSMGSDSAARPAAQQLREAARQRLNALQAAGMLFPEDDALHRSLAPLATAARRDLPLRQGP